MTLTREQEQELTILSHATDRGKFAVPLTMNPEMSLSQTEALERLQIRRWIILIDVSLIAHAKGIHRIFLLSDEAMKWKNDHV